MSSSKLDEIIMENVGRARITGRDWQLTENGKDLKQQIKSLFLEIVESCNNTWGNGRATPGEHINTEDLRKKIKEL